MLLLLRLIYIALLSAIELFTLNLLGLDVLAPLPIFTVVLITLLAVIIAPFLPLLLETSHVTQARERGEVKWFNVSKGYGFITREGGGDVFVHFRSIRGQSNERRGLNEGQQVEFVLTQGEKGPQAEDVKILS